MGLPELLTAATVALGGKAGTVHGRLVDEAISEQVVPVDSRPVATLQSAITAEAVQALGGWGGVSVCVHRTKILAAR